MVKTKKNSKREVGVQSIVQPKYYDSPHILSSKNLEHVEFSYFFYTPHTIMGLIVSIILINFLIYFGPELTGYSSKSLALMSCIFLFVLFAAFYMPDTIVTRPHPFIWRAMLGVNVVYSVFMIYMAFLPLDEARQVMHALDNKLGKPLPEKSYAEDCRLFTPEDPTSIMRNLSDSIDVHVFAHFAGWTAKVLIMRDIKVCWICSILFEVLELTFRHWLPNFYE